MMDSIRRICNHLKESVHQKGYGTHERLDSCFFKHLSESRMQVAKQLRRPAQARLAEFGLSSEGCLEKSDLVERLLGK